MPTTSSTRTGGRTISTRGGASSTGLPPPRASPLPPASGSRLADEPGVNAAARGKEGSMKLGRVLLRVTVGAIFIEHGTQKLFGWFGGHGPDGTGQFFESVGLRPGRSNAMMAGATEAGGGALLTLGLATPLAATSLASVMVTALRKAIRRDG